MALLPRSNLFGRQPELALLDEVLDASSARGSALTIWGDAGTGKSALLVEAGRQAEEMDMLVLRATGVESEAKMPFAGLHQLLSPVLGELDGLVAGQREAMLEAFGSTSRRPEVFLVALAALNLLGDIASRQPVAVLVDDVHWLDGATLQVLGFIARRLEADPVVLLMSCRSGFDDPLGVAGAPVIELECLDDLAAAELLDASFPTLTGRSRELVLQLAAGNPLALLELPAVVDTIRSEPRADWLPLTSRLERAFAVSMLDLPPATRWLLLVLALDDRPSLGEVLAATATLVEPPPTLHDLAPAEAAGLISTHERDVRFRHPLMRSAVRQAAGTAERHAVHAALAEALAHDPDRSIWHRAASTVAPDESVAAQLEATAAGLRERHETASAITALRRAAELTSSPARKGARLVAAAELALELGRNQEVVELVDEAEPLELEMRTRHSILWLRAALAESSGTGSVESITKVAEQLIAEGEPRLAVHALYTAAVRCYMFKVDGEAPITVSRVAGRLGLPDGDPTLAAIHALAAPADWRSRIVDEARSRTPEQLIRASPDAASAMEALHVYGIALTCVSEFGIGIVFQDAAIAGLRTQGRLGVLARALGSHSVGRLALADWHLATQAADECLRLSGYVPGAPGASTDGERILNMGSALLVLATIAANRGQDELAETLVGQAVQVEGSIGSNFCLAHIQAARASLALAAGRSADAFHHLIRIFDPGDIAYHWGTSRSGNVVRDLADAARASGNTPAAVALLEPLRNDANSEEARGTLAYVDAVLADVDAEDRFRHALANAPASGYFQARAELSFGMWLRRERRKIEARAHLRSAIDGFEAIGAVPWAERSRQELRASGESVRRKEPDRRDELSPQEMQIAQLAAEGLTNREIGAQLFLSHRTVGSHLYRIFPKLDVTSRAGLAAVLKGTAPRDPS